MIVDFHTHIFPEKIAQRTLDLLKERIHINPYTNGLIDGLKSSMEEAGIGLSVVLPTMTLPKQYESILKFADFINELPTKANEPKLLSFAGIHPDCEDISQKLTQIKNMGFKGIKLHPDYQGTMFDDIHYLRILDKASELDLVTLTHTGFDVLSPDCIHCSVDSILHVLKEVAPKNLVLAHMGNNEHYDLVEQELLGADVYLDTAYSITHMKPEQFVRMVKGHGADKILFGTDSPWVGQKDGVNALRAMELSEEEKEKILCLNGMKLLKL